MSDHSRRSLSELAKQCAKETSQYFSNGGAPGQSCYQLFKLAIIDRDQEAWEILYRQYEPLVKGWVLRHPAYAKTNEEADYFVNAAFTRVWQAITPEKFQRFEDTSSILRYLQVCTNSVILDNLRQRANEAYDIDADDVRHQIDQRHGRNVADMHRSLYFQQLFEAVNQRMKTEQERIVLYEVYVLDVKPSDIFKRHPHTFKNVKEIYRIKENILARLRRDEKLKKLFQ